MATEFNYVVNVDTTRVMGAMHEVRSQMGMALGSPSGMGMGDVMAGVTGGLRQMFNMPHLQPLPPGGFSTPDIEKRIQQGGIAAAVELRPPGVSAATFATAVESNRITRNLEASHAARMAGEAAFASGMGGLIGGEMAWAPGAFVGGALGKKVATRFLGAGAGGAGKMLGGFAGGIAAFGMVQEAISGSIQDHYAQIEQTSGIARELGEIAGAGRNLSRTQRYDLGGAAASAAKDINMDVQQMGDILALGRQAGMLPTATDPGKAREQFKEFARTIEEGAQTLQSSLATATQVIRSSIQKGMTADEGIVRAAAAGSPEAYLQGLARHSAYVGAGGAIGEQMRYTKSQGMGVFTASLRAASGAGLTGAEMQILGGRYGVGQMIGTAQMAAAAGPLGDMQLMAATSGEPLGDMMGMAGAAIDAMSGGEGFLTNMMKFQVHKDELRRGIGSKGIQTMARQQLEMGADMLESFGFGGTANERKRFFAQNVMGMDPTQAEAYVGGTTGRRGGGGGGGGIGGGVGAAGQMRAFSAMQGQMLEDLGPRPEVPTSGGGGSLGGRVVDYAATGAMVGSFLPGGLLTTAGGAAVGGAIAIGSSVVDAFSGSPSNLAGRLLAKRYDEKMAERKKAFGIVEVDEKYGERFLQADLGGARLNLDSASPETAEMTSSYLMAMGLKPVAAGAGTFKAGDKYFSAPEVQKISRGKLWSEPVSSKDKAGVRDLAYAIAYEPGSDSRYARGTRGRNLRNDIKNFGLLWETMAAGEEITPDEISDRYGGMKIDLERGQYIPQDLRRLIESAPDTGGLASTKKRLLQRLEQPGGIRSPEVRALVSSLIGRDAGDLEEGTKFAIQGGALSAEKAVEEAASNEQRFLMSVFGNVGSQAEDFWLGGKREGFATRLRRKDYFESLTTNKSYLEGKAAAARGNADRASQLLEQAHKEVMISGGERFRDLGIRPVDLSEKVVRPEAGPVAAALGFASAVGSIGEAFGIKNADVVSKVSKEIGKDVLRKTSVAEQIGIEEASVGPLQKDKKGSGRARGRRGPQEMEKAIGFGQQESALTTINRSLKRTHSMLVKLDKKINSGGESGGGNSAPGSTN